MQCDVLKEETHDLCKIKLETGHALYVQPAVKALLLLGMSPQEIRDNYKNFKSTFKITELNVETTEDKKE